MYAVIEYKNSKVDPCFKIIYLTSVSEYAKQVAYNSALLNIEDEEIAALNNDIKVTTKINTHHIQSNNETIVEYMKCIVTETEVIHVGNIYAVAKIMNIEPDTMDSIDKKTLCDIPYEENSDDNEDNDNSELDV